MMPLPLLAVEGFITTMPGLHSLASLVIGPSALELGSVPAMCLGYLAVNIAKLGISVAGKDLKKPSLGGHRVKEFRRHCLTACCVICLPAHRSQSYR